MTHKMKCWCLSAICLCEHLTTHIYSGVSVTKRYLQVTFLYPVPVYNTTQATTECIG